jgi:hypothetical protein
LGLSRTGKEGSCPLALTMPLVANSDCDGQHTFVLCVQPCEGASRKGTHIAKLALLGNYMAASFVTAADGHGGTLITEASQTANQLLATPHKG